MMQLRKSLDRCHQNNKSITEYTHELHELFNMIGDIQERDRVLKFWNGVRPVIQKGLWHDSLNPETSSWDKVVTQAEIIEISENVAERWDCQSNTSRGSMNNQGGGQAKAKTTCPMCQLTQLPMTKCKLTLGLAVGSTQDGLSMIRPPWVGVSCHEDEKALVSPEVTVAQHKEVDLKLLAVIDMTPETLLNSLKRKKQKDWLPGSASIVRKLGTSAMTAQPNGP